MSSVRLDWHGDEFKKVAREGVAVGLNKAAVIAQDRAIVNFGTSGGGVVSKTKKGRNVYAPSPAGGFPGIRTGTLRRSVNVDLASPKDLVARVGTNLKYGRMLEEGTRDMPARPWLFRSVNPVKAKMLNKLVDAATNHIARKFGGAA